MPSWREELIEPKDCPDCGVHPGVAHLEECDTARCLVTGGSRLGCYAETVDEEDLQHYCGNDMWTGIWPATEDAIRLGFFCRWVDRDSGEPIDFRLNRRGTWQGCGPDDEGARPNLNRLRPPYAEWNRETGHWERP